jgi:O-antigen ligase
LAAALPGAAVMFVARAFSRRPETSGWARFFDWRTALLIIRDHGLLGIGKGNYVHVAKLYNPWALPYPVHNVFLWVWAETGLAGLAGFGAMVYGAFRNAARSLGRALPLDDAYAAAALAAFLGLALRMFVSMSFVHPFVSLTFLALAAAAGWPAAAKDPS